jgi:hypothetical protein
MPFPSVVDLCTKFLHLLKNKPGTQTHKIKCFDILTEEMFFLLYPNGTISEIAYTVFWFCAYRPIKTL